MKLDKTQRKELAKTLNDIAKLVIAALVIGQFIALEKFNIFVFTIAFLISLLLIVLATLLNKEE
ncbi:MAG: hypothetical protein ACK4JE_06130 [Endomicrobiia bacterium]